MAVVEAAGAGWASGWLGDVYGLGSSLRGFHMEVYWPSCLRQSSWPNSEFRNRPQITEAEWLIRTIPKSQVSGQ